MQVPDALSELVAELEADAETLRRFGAEAQAAAVLRCTERIRATCDRASSEMVDLKTAAELSGYSTRRLRQLARQGQLEDHGRKGAPRFRVDELPVKPRAANVDRFSPRAVALRAISGT